MKFGFSDVVYNMMNEEKRKQFLDYLEEINFKDLRFGLNLVSLKSKNIYGDVKYLLNFFELLQKKNFNIHIYLFLSDDIANAGQGSCPGEWRAYSLEELAENLGEDCKRCVDIFRENSITIKSYTIGNESEWGICGYRLNDKVDVEGLSSDEEFDWLRANLWAPTAYLLKACCKVIKEYAPECDIIIHSDSIGKKQFTSEYFRYLEEEKVPFDKIGLTYNPWTIWDEDYHCFEKIERTIKKLKKWDKPIWIVEYCYPNKPVTNGELSDILPDERYTYTRAGQLNFHLDFISFCRKNDIERLFFWRPEHETKDDLSSELGIFEGGRMDRRLLRAIDKAKE